ncbi:hypothetical protein D3C78_1164030 [compost metagenome]
MQAALLQVAGQPGGCLPVVLAEGGVGVDFGAVALADDEFRAVETQVRVEGGAVAALHAVVGPEGLFAVAHLDGLERRAALVAAGEAEVSGRVPVLGQDDMGEGIGQPVDRRDDILATRYRQRATAAEVVLHVGHQQYVMFARVQFGVHAGTSSFSIARHGAASKVIRQPLPRRASPQTVRRGGRLRSAKAGAALAPAEEILQRSPAPA